MSHKKFLDGRIENLADYRDVLGEFEFRMLEGRPQNWQDLINRANLLREQYEYLMEGSSLYGGMRDCGADLGDRCTSRYVALGALHAANVGLIGNFSTINDVLDRISEADEIGVTLIEEGFTKCSFELVQTNSGVEEYLPLSPTVIVREKISKLPAHLIQKFQKILKIA